MVVKISPAQLIGTTPHERVSKIISKLQAGLPVIPLYNINLIMLGCLPNIKYELLVPPSGETHKDCGTACSAGHSLSYSVCKSCFIHF